MELITAVHSLTVNDMVTEYFLLGSGSLNFRGTKEKIVTNSNAQIVFFIVIIFRIVTKVTGIVTQSKNSNIYLLLL